MSGGPADHPPTAAPSGSSQSVAGDLLHSARLSTRQGVSRRERVALTRRARTVSLQRRADGGVVVEAEQRMVRKFLGALVPRPLSDNSDGRGARRVKARRCKQPSRNPSCGTAAEDDEADGEGVERSSRSGPTAVRTRRRRSLVGEKPCGPEERSRGGADSSMTTNSAPVQEGVPVDRRQWPAQGNRRDHRANRGRRSTSRSQRNWVGMPRPKAMPIGMP